jgi:hypothetical protein
MFGIIMAVLRSLGATFQTHRQLELENLALRHQLLMFSRNAKKPRFRKANITAARITHLRELLRPKDRIQLLRDLRNAPA